MKKQLYSIIMVGLIGISGVAQPQDNVPLEAVKTAEIKAASPGVMPVQAAAPKKAPILVPFDRNLYKECCEVKAQQHHRTIFYRQLPQVLFGVIALSTVAYHCKDLAVLKGLWATLMASSWWGRISISFDRMQKGFLYGATIFSGFFATKAIGREMNRLTTWEDRLALGNMFDDMQKKTTIWHEETFTYFGRPEVVGKAPLTGKYIIKGYKKYGAGQVIFDPFDPEQIRILLGVHPTITEDLRCSKIEIIIVGETK